MECRCIRQLKAGDRKAAQELLEHYGEPLMGYLFSILGRRENAEDAFQETWLKVMMQIGGFQSDMQFSPWLFRIARNTAFDHLRWKRRWQFLTLARGEDEPPFELPTSEDPAGQCLDRLTVQRLLKKLGPVYREMIWLRFYQGMSYEEMAILCGLPLGTVKSRLKRALDKLAVAHAKSEG
ncbi:MAG: RNA polymerase sigma factor [Acidobacteriota bacterium]